jgi:hypothetical protein
MSRHVLVLMPQAVASSWLRVIDNLDAMQPWSHQRSMIEWAADRPSCMISADMGTGKTPTALWIAGRDNLVPLDITQGSGASRAKRLAAALASTPQEHTLVILCNYEGFWRGDVWKQLEKAPIACIVADESHRLKSPQGRASKAAHKLAQRHPQARRLLLTGTPMPQGPLDLYGQFRFLHADIFGTSYARFRTRYAECDPRFPSKVRRYRNQDELTQKLDANSYRVEADEVLSLPDAIHEQIPVTLSPATRRFYDALANDLTADIEAGTVTASNALARLLRLAQAAGGHTKTDDGATVAIDGVSAKRRMLEDRLSDLPATEPVVVFCRFRADLEEVRAAAAEQRQRNSAGHTLKSAGR